MSGDAVIGLGVLALATISLVLSLWLLRRARRGRRQDPIDRETAEEIQQALDEKNEARYRDGFGV